MNKPLKILQASAGSGKTFSLTAHYLTLLFSQDNRYREILAVTFTNKATEEMKTRILDVLSALAKGDKEVDNIRDIILASHPRLNPETLQAQAEKIYRKILHDYGRFSVSTIDGFVQRVIRGFAFELGLDSGYALEMNFEKVKSDLADRLNAQLENNPNLLDWIIKLALERIDSNKSWNYHHALIDLAGEIFKERYQPFENAMQELLADKDIDALFNEYQATTQSVLKNFEDSINSIAVRAAKIFEGTELSSLKGMSRSPLTNISKIVDGDFEKIEKLGNLLDNVSEWFKPGNSDALFFRLNPVLKELYQFYFGGLPEYTLAAAVNENLYYLRLMQEMANLLKAYRQESGTLLISDAQHLLQGIAGTDDSNPSFIWEKMGNRYHHFLFDEFQDTSGSQWTNFKPLLTNAMAEATGELVDHLIVGDVKQSIYRWRNGDWNILHQQAKTDIGEAYIVDDNLEANYRSTENIISFNNLLFEYAPRALQQQLNEKVADEAGTTVKQWWAQLGNDSIIPGVYSQATQVTHKKTPKGGCISFNVLRTDSEGNDLKADTFRAASMQHSIAEIRRLVNDKGFAFGDVCILVRANSEAVQAVEALMAEGIPVISGEALLIAGNTAVKLLINTLRSIEGLPNNTAIHKAACISLYAKINGLNFTPGHLFGLEYKTLDELHYALPPALCSNWRNWLHSPLPELIEKLIAAYQLDRAEQSQHLAYLLAFRDLAGSFANQGEKGLSAFLQWWEDEGSFKALPSSEHSEAVQVITIHKSKGLAFRSVLLPFCGWPIDGRAGAIFWVPSENTAYQGLKSIPVRYKKSLANSTVAKAYFEELLYNYMDALNMLYVATTRTKEHLFIVTQGKKTASKISDIGDLLVGVIKLFPGFSAFFKDDDNMLWEEAVVKVDSVRGTEEALYTSIKLEGYPLSGRLSDVLSTEQEHGENDLLSRNIALREGAVLHEILSRAADRSADLDKVLQQMLLEGYLRKDELSSFKERVIKVTQHPELQALLASGGQALNEKSIIAATGRSYRPDKVLVSGIKVTVIDYKFTQNEEPSHIRQVRGYKELLLDMGYQQVDTYLFYALSGTLKAI